MEHRCKLDINGSYVEVVFDYEYEPPDHACGTCAVWEIYDLRIITISGDGVELENPAQFLIECKEFGAELKDMLVNDVIESTSPY